MILLVKNKKCRQIMSIPSIYEIRYLHFHQVSRANIIQLLGRKLTRNSSNNEYNCREGEVESDQEENDNNDRELDIEQTEVSTPAASAADDVSHADSLTLPSHSNQSPSRPSTSQLSIPLSPPHSSRSLLSTYDICDIPSAPPLQGEQPNQSLPQTATPSTPTASKRAKPLVSAVSSPIATRAAPSTPAPADLTSSRRTTRASAASDARRTSLPAVIPSSPKAKKNVPESEQQVAQSRARKTTRAASPAAKEDIPERRSISRTRKSTAEETTTSPVAKKALPEAVTSPRYQIQFLFSLD